jgi:VanZ family protein
MRSRFWILLWIFGILFPMAFLGSLWPPFGRLFNALFAANWTHIAMHAFLYAVLAFLLARWFRPVSVRATLILLGLAVGIGCLQEGLQWLTMKSEIGWSASAFDLMVDTAGTLLGLIVGWQWSFRRPGTVIKQK